MMEYCGIVSIT